MTRRHARPLRLQRRRHCHGDQLHRSSLKRTQRDWGASSQYQDALQFLNALLLTLQHLQYLDTKFSDPSLNNAVRTLALAAQKTILNFISQIQKYDPALGTAPTSGAIRGGLGKAEWALTVTKKVEALRTRIAAQMQPIHLLLESQNL